MAKIFCPICGEERTAQVSTEPKSTRDQTPQRAYRCEVCGNLAKKEDMR